MGRCAITAAAREDGGLKVGKGSLDLGEIETGLKDPTSVISIYVLPKSITIECNDLKN